MVESPHKKSGHQYSMGDQLLKSRYALWAAAELVIVVVLVVEVLTMLQQGFLAVFILGASSHQAEGKSGGYYFQQSQDILGTMQQDYWNGTYWVNMQHRIV